MPQRGVHKQGAGFREQEPNRHHETNSRIPISNSQQRPNLGIGVALQQANQRGNGLRQTYAAGREGSPAAFDELVHRYDRLVLRLALGIVKSEEDARDIYQETFLKAWKGIRRFRNECSFGTWIFRIATNLCLDHARRRGAHPPRFPRRTRRKANESSATSRIR